MSNWVKITIAAVFIAVVLVFLVSERKPSDTLMSINHAGEEPTHSKHNEKVELDGIEDVQVSTHTAEGEESGDSALTEVEMIERSDSYRAKAERYSDNLDDDDTRDQLSSSLKNDHEYKKAILDKFKQERNSKLDSE